MPNNPEVHHDGCAWGPCWSSRQEMPNYTVDVEQWSSLFKIVGMMLFMKGLLLVLRAMVLASQILSLQPDPGDLLIYVFPLGMIGISLSVGGLGVMWKKYWGSEVSAITELIEIGFLVFWNLMDAVTHRTINGDLIICLEGVSCIIFLILIVFLAVE